MPRTCVLSVRLPSLLLHIAGKFRGTEWKEKDIGGKKKRLC